MDQAPHQFGVRRGRASPRTRSVLAVLTALASAVACGAPTSSPLGDDTETRAPVEDETPPHSPRADVLRAAGISTLGDAAFVLLTDGRVAYARLPRSDPSAGTDAVRIGLVPSLDDAEQVSGRCARRRGGAVVCWSIAWTPEPIEGLPPIDHLSAATTLACGISEGRVWCWGFPGDPDPTGGDPMAMAPRRVERLEGVADLACGGESTCLAVDREGAIWRWATRSRRTSPAIERPRRLTVRDARGAPLSVAVGMTEACVRYAEGVVCSGPTTANEQVWIESSPSFTNMAAGAGQACGVAGGRLRCWGLRGVGRDERYDPAPVEVTGISDVAELAGSSAFCARLVDGRVICWRPSRMGEPLRPDEQVELPLAGVASISSGGSG